MNIKVCAMLSAVAHALLFFYGEFHDAISDVKYTDVDYFVFTDAAELFSEGKSPFDRATYRYTPVLAWILYPGIYLHPSWGKILFCLVDVLVGSLIYAIIRQQNVGIVKSLYCASAWLFNPMALVVSSRGNAESIVAALVLYSVLLILRKESKLAGLVYGFSVHFKIYPVIFAASFYFALGLQWSKAFKQKSLFLYALFWPNVIRINFVVFAILGFIIPTYVSYLLYGSRYIEEAFLYHVTRRDVKHNFSPYFYLIYLTGDQPGIWISLISFLPQAFVVVIVALKYHRPADLPFCVFLQTYAFVTFNKVCTSQYFLWFLSLLPLVIPKLKFRWKSLLAVVSLWIASQAVWLFAAYSLEFRNADTFLYLWIAGLLFFCSNILVMEFFVKAYGCKVRK